MRQIRLGFILLTLFAVCLPAQAIRQASISSYVNVGSPAAVSWFSAGGAFAFSGGVSPVSSNVKFFINDTTVVSINDLTLTFRPTTGESAVRLTYNNTEFVLPMPRAWVCPIANFVGRDGTIAFTVPEADDAEFFTKNHLVQFESSNAYVASEFSNPKFAIFLKDLDLEQETFTEDIPEDVETALIGEIHAANKIKDTAQNEASHPDSYVNADFHVTYYAYLEQTSRGASVDIAGQPLRYFWSVEQSSGAARIHAIQAFRYPGPGEDLLRRSILFYQDSAVLRAFKEKRPMSFYVFRSVACR